MEWGTVLVGTASLLGLMMWLKNRKTKTIPEGAVRKLSEMEGQFETMHKLELMIVSHAYFVHAKEDVCKEKLEHILCGLMERHPGLRMCITKDPFTSDYYLSEIKHIKVPLTEVSDASWKEVLQKETRTKFDVANGPLWRAVLVTGNGTENEVIKRDKEFPHLSAIVLSFHHAIEDGGCRMNLVKEIVTCYFNETKRAILNEKLPMVQPIDDYFPELKPGKLGQFLSTILRFAMQFDFVIGYLATKACPSAANKFFKRYPAVISKYPDTEKKTCVIPSLYTKEDTQKLLAACRKNGATITGAFYAAAIIGMNHLLRKADTTESEDLALKGGITVSLRKVLNVDTCHMSPFMSGFEMKERRYGNQVTTSDFWLAASDSTKEIRNRFENKEYMKFLKMITTMSHMMGPDIAGKFIGRMVNMTSKTASRMSNGVFSFNSIGNWVISNEEDSFRMAGVFGCSGEHVMGPIFSHNIATVDGKLCYGLGYFTSVTTEELANEYLTNIKTILHDAVQ